MSKPLSLYPVRHIPLDANGLPLGHRQAQAEATKLLRDMVNSLPDSVYHLNQDDAEWVAGNLVQVYLASLERV